MATDEIALDRVHRMGRDEYHRLVESGGFEDDARIELIDGLLVDMSLVFNVDAPRPYHAATADLVIKHRLYARAGVTEC